MSETVEEEEAAATPAERRRLADRFAFLKTTSLAALIATLATIFTAFTSYNSDRSSNTIEENKRRMEQTRQDFEREKFSKEYLLNLQDKVAANLAAGNPDLAVALVLNEPPCSATRTKLANLLVTADYVSTVFEGTKAKTLQASISQLKEESRNADPDGGAPITCQIEDKEHKVADLKSDLDAVLASQKGSVFAMLDHRDEDLKVKLAAEQAVLATLKKQLVRPSRTTTVSAPPPGAAAPAASAEAPPEFAQPPEPLTVNYGGNVRGWDIDVFYCDAAKNNQTNAKLVAAKLAEQATLGKDLGGGFTLGRIRLRALRDEAGEYAAAGDEIRAEVSETDQGNTLAGFLAKTNSGNFAIRQSPAATPWYLSVFVCSASASAGSAMPDSQ